MSEKESGVSVVICCHNSAQRLSETLAHLARQQAPPEIAWEVLVVDNASTDDTVEIARRAWPGNAPAALRITHEPNLGLAHARRRGFLESRFELVSFVDDDNWVCDDWVAQVARIMDRHPQVGLLGGSATAVPEGPVPAWFAAHSGSFAVGEQAHAPGECRHLWGAGLTIRKAVWLQLRDAGFVPALAGRRGSSLTAGEDSEICLAAALAGWHLYYEPELKLHHFIPSSRLTWDHLRKLYRGFGAARVYLPLYQGWWEDNDYSRTAHLSWFGRLWFSLRDLYGKRRSLFARPVEGDPEALYAEWSRGFFGALLREALAYSRNARGIRQLRRFLSSGRPA